MSHENSLERAMHVAIIMDGNGRWATSQGLPRVAGHKAGAGAVRRAVEMAVDQGIGWLTLFAFSSDNWQRPPAEVSALLALFGDFLQTEVDSCLKHGIRLSVIGRRDRLGRRLERLIERAERETSGGAALHLRLAIDYSARDAILRAAQRLALSEEPTREAFGRLLSEPEPPIPRHGSSGAPGGVSSHERGGPAGETSPVSRAPEEHPVAPQAAECGGRSGPTRPPDVDLMIRTGGEQRLSDFLLWESAYAELVFLDRMWPDFQKSDFEAALREFRRRDRRFGTISPGLAL